MSSPLCFNRSSRIERQAYKWVMKMFDDPGHHAPALARWLDKDPEHRVVYKRVAIEVGYASDAAAQLPSLRADARMAVRTPPPSRRAGGSSRPASSQRRCSCCFCWAGRRRDRQSSSPPLTSQ